MSDVKFVWTIKIKTILQHNICCVDSENKVAPYIKSCLSKVNKKTKYIIKWLCSDFAVIEEKVKKGRIIKRLGEIHKLKVE